MSLSSSGSSISPSPASSSASHTQQPKVVIHDFIRFLIGHSPQTPCSLIANVYSEIVPPEKRFQIALDELLPALAGPSDYSARVAAAYLLYTIYAPHPIDINPFKSALVERFNVEKGAAVAPTEQRNGKASGVEQFIWVLYKILQGEGEELGSRSPLQLLSEPLEPHMLPASLSLHTEDQGPESAQSTVSKYQVEEPAPSQPAPTPTTVPSTDAPLSQAISLLLSAKSRVLNLSEQRVLKSHLPDLASPLPVLKPRDIPSLIANNCSLAHPYLVHILTSSTTSSFEWDAYIHILSSLPPTLSSFDLLGKLLRDETTFVLPGGSRKYTVADVVRMEVVGGFVHHCVEWIEAREQDAAARGDDSIDKASSNLCRFYASLLSNGTVDATSDVETAEMAHFALGHSKLEACNTLYRMFALARV